MIALARHLSMPLSLALLLVLLSGFPAAAPAAGPHIADVNLLLPPRMTHDVEYRLIGSDGCFSWSWDHHDILDVQPEFNGSSRCSTSARLRSIAPYDGRKETAVYANDLSSGVVIRCRVFIDKISRIQIFHNSVKLDLDGLTTLRVRAFDSEENVFSSLVGLQFMWKLMPEHDDEDHRLVHVPLKESPLSDCGGFCGDLVVQIKIEDIGLFSDLYVVKGTEIGHEIVSVNLAEPHFDQVADKIVLTVAEAMSIDPPSPVFVINGASVRYTLKIIRQNVPQVVTLPSPHHHWSVTNSSVASVDSLTGVVTAVNLGVATVAVTDIRVVGHIQMSSLHVVLPDTLCMYKLPLSASGNPIEGVEATPSMTRWYVVIGRLYLIYVKVFSREPGAHEIYITQSDDVKLQCESAYWELLSVSDKISFRHGRHARVLLPTSPGSGRITASLSYNSGYPEKIEVMKVLQEIIACERVKLVLRNRNEFYKVIQLPWAPGVYQELELQATGGCMETPSDYKWYSSDLATVYVSASGVVQAKKPGKATIKVVSAFDPMNFDEVVVKVSTPFSMVMLKNFPLETVVGTYLQAAVTLEASDGTYFYTCDSFNTYISWNSGSESFKIVNMTSEVYRLKLSDNGVSESLYGPPCAWAYIYASDVGRALLHATFLRDLQSSSHQINSLKASSHIVSYSPLIVQHGGNGNKYGGYWVDLVRQDAGREVETLNELYLAPGTVLDLVLVGGPERWGQGVEFIENVDIFDEKHVQIKEGILVDQISEGRDGSYRLSCLMLGNFQLVFSRGNLVGSDHPVPVIEKVELSLSCAFPSAITLLANEPVNSLDLIEAASQAERAPGKIRAMPITVANGCTIRVAAVGIHYSGKAFANSSSLCLKWELNDCNGLANWYTDGLETSRTSWERFLVLENATGMCVVRATVVGYSNAMIGVLHEKASSLLDKTDNLLTDAIPLQLVSSLRVVPEFMLLFFSREAKVNLSITGGTCFLDAVVNDTQVLRVIQPPPNLQCSHIMLAPKALGVALVTVRDMGLVPHASASAVVRVADIDWIKIVSLEDISLMAGDEKSLEILAGAQDGCIFDSSQYAFMDVHVHIEGDAVELVNINVDYPFAEDLNVPNLVIRGNSLGVATLYVSARQQSGREIVSHPVKVEVYAAPTLFPDDMFLAPGASYMLTLRGGPKIGTRIQYESLNEGTAEVHQSSGRISAVSPGNTTIRALVYGNKGSVVCEVRARVRVGIPSSAILSLQSEKLSVGREMPVFPALSKGNLFSFYELCKNYEWTIEDEQILSFQSHQQSHGEFSISAGSNSDERNLNFINVVCGRSGGETNISVSFSCDFKVSGVSKSVSYSASTSVLVVGDPPLALGVPITWFLPPFYTSSNLLPLSSDSSSRLNSYSHRGTIAYSMLKTCGWKNEENAIFIDGSKIRTMETNNLDCIQATDQTTGRVEIASCVRIAEVAQIRVITENFPFHVADLGVGAELDLAAKYYDALGNPFKEAYNVFQLVAETNYLDVVSINETCGRTGDFTVKAMQPGRALVRISIKDSPQKSAYMMILVGAHLRPENPILHVGGYLKFSMKGLEEDVHGRWLSSNASVISIDERSGEAHATGEGAAHVIFEGSSLKLHTTATVHPVNLVFVESPAETLTNVPFPTKGYPFSVRFSDTYNTKLDAAAKSKGVQYDCRVDPPFVGYAKPWQDLDSGNAYCLFFPYSPKHYVLSVPKSEIMGPEISVSVNASVIGPEIVTGSSTSLFIGGFLIFEADKGLMQLNLTQNSNKTTITILGNTEVEIHWEGRNLMMVTLIRQGGFGIGGHAEYEVKAVKSERFKDKIIITLPATGQRAELDVSYEPGETKPSPTASVVTVFAGAIVCLVVLVATVAIAIRYIDRPDRPRLPTLAATNTNGLTTPDRNGPQNQNLQRSPRTPPPFLDYVRRTIDDTPYYKNDGRRRFNPQNTY
ncbi:hypothetical protein Scep_017914 [Stephania cephalantha]|uniref:BIG2 domain-containing protein n=1 Tax=Stephania cephalantha TaxID=152367 RepID=A0AAP0ISG7_9MAGN